MEYEGKDIPRDFAIAARIIEILERKGMSKTDFANSMGKKIRRYLSEADTSYGKKQK